MHKHSVHAVPEVHPLHKVTGQRLFDAVFGHLHGPEREKLVAAEAAQNKAAVEQMGGAVILNAIHYDGDKIVFGYERAPD